MHPRLSVSGVCTFTWDLGRDVDFWADAGVTRVGIPYIKLEAMGWDASVDLVRRSGVEVTNVIGPGLFRLDRPTTWDEHRPRLDRCLAAAAAVGAGCLVLTTGSPGSLTWEAAAEAATAAWGGFLRDAEARSVPVAFEHTSAIRADLGFLHTLRDAIEVGRQMGVGVCVEPTACWVERGLSETIRSGIDTIRIAQVSDFVIGTIEARNRAVPGDGDLPLRWIIGELLDAGYEGVFDLELLGPRIELEGFPSAIRRGIDAVSEMLWSLGA